MSNAALKAEKVELNLASVTPQGPPIEMAEIDTTTPTDVTVIPFTEIHFAKWGPWVLGRLALIFPHLNNFNFRGILGQHIGVNTSLFLRTKKALILAVVTRETLEPRPYIDIVFCLKHFPEVQEDDKEVRLLFRRVEDWARGHGAIGIRMLHQDRCDMAFAKTKEGMRADEKKIVVKEIVK